MKKSSILFWVLFFMVGCTGPKVVTYLNNELDYTAYETYYLISLKGRTKTQSDNVIPKLERLIHQKMEERGYKIEKDNPDLLLRYELVASTETEATNFGMTYPQRGFATFNTFNTSILLIEMRDQNQDKLVWHASIDMQDHQEIRNNKDPIKMAVEQIFNTFLYEAGNSSINQNLKQ